VAKRTERRERDAAEGGRRWAGDVSRRFREEGRRSTGGWPGTLTEARSRVVTLLGEGDPPSQDELATLAQILYRAARKEWLRDCNADD
jgi:hypothetical protein